MYSAHNSYLQDYHWVTDDTGRALPVDVEFYRAMFTNGTKAGMRMFEQDFLCTVRVWWVWGCADGHAAQHRHPPDQRGRPHWEGVAGGLGSGGGGVQNHTAVLHDEPVSGVEQRTPHSWNCSHTGCTR